MTLRIPNILFGFTMLFITAVLGGMTLGATFDAQSVSDGYHSLSLQRFYLREGHSHGNFMCFFNLFVGLTVNNLQLSERLKTVCSYSAMAAILLPIGLAAKGAAGAPADFPPFGLIGVVGVAVALVILIVGTWRSRKA